MARSYRRPYSGYVVMNHHYRRNCKALARRRFRRINKGEIPDGCFYKKIIDIAWEYDIYTNYIGFPKPAKLIQGHRLTIQSKVWMSIHGPKRWHPDSPTWWGEEWWKLIRK